MVHLARSYGPFVRTRLPMHIYFVSGPALIEEILVKQASHFQKDPITRVLSRGIGAGLVVSEGELWRRQRRLMQPAFHQGELRSYGGVMNGLAHEAIAGWRSGETRNLHEDMMALTLNIVAKLLFGANLAADARDIGTTISALLEDFSGELGLRALTPFAHLPSPRSWRIRRRVRELDRIIYKIIADRRAAADPGQRPARAPPSARDEDGSRMTDRQLRDEAMTLFVAGHETTALALTYALYLLAAHPGQQEPLAAELGQVLAGRDAEFTDLERLKLTEAVLLEGMRLYPPVWSVGRQALVDVEIGGYRLPKGSTFFISQWVMHRDPSPVRESGEFSARALGRRRAAPPAAIRLFPFRRRPAHLHREPLRDDGSDVDPRRARPAFLVRDDAGNQTRPPAQRDAAPAFPGAPANHRPGPALTSRHNVAKTASAPRYEAPYARETGAWRLLAAAVRHPFVPFPTPLFGPRSGS